MFGYTESEAKGIREETFMMMMTMNGPMISIVIVIAIAIATYKESMRQDRTKVI